MIAARLREIAERDPATPALIAGDVAISRAELNRAGAAARRTLEEAGLRPGGFAMVSLPVSIEAAVIFVACAELGAVFLPVNADVRNAELKWLLSQALPSLVIVERDDFERWVDAGVDSSLIGCVDRIVCPTAEELPGNAPPEWPADHVVASMLSSGSTGRPKIGLWTMARVLGISSAMARACSIGPGSRLLATVPLHHGHGLANGLMMPLLSGATVILLKRFDPLEAARAIERHSVDYLIGSPVLFNLLVDANVPASALRSLRVCLSGGAPLAPAVAEAWNRLCGTPVRQAYGSWKRA